MTVDVIKKNHKAVDATSPAALWGLQMPIRTLWHALYFPERVADSGPDALLNPALKSSYLLKQGAEIDRLPFRLQDDAR